MNIPHLSGTPLVDPATKRGSPATIDEHGELHRGPSLDEVLGTDGRGRSASDDVNASDGGPDDLKAWRRHSVKLISSIIESASTAHQVTKGRLSIVDLAGSEDVGRSGATGATLAEAKKINTSLLALGNCIAALTDASQKHVPFRDSVLTRLLQESFGGNCKTTLIVCCSPAEADLSETLSTLRFGARARKVRNFAKVNAVVDVTALAEQLQAPRLAESLQQQLDSQEQLLRASRARSEVHATRALQLAVKLRMARREAEGLREEQGSLQQRNVRNYETTEAAEAAAAREAAAAKAARREASKAKAEAEAAHEAAAALRKRLSERQAGRLKESDKRAEAARRAEATAAAAAEKLRAGDAAHAATLAEHEVELMAATEAAAKKARAEAAAAVARAAKAAEAAAKEQAILVEENNTIKAALEAARRSDQEHRAEGDAPVAAGGGRRCVRAVKRGWRRWRRRRGGGVGG